MNRNLTRYLSALVLTGGILAAKADAQSASTPAIPPNTVDGIQLPMPRSDGSSGALGHGTTGGGRSAGIAPAHGLTGGARVLGGTRATGVGVNGASGTDSGGAAASGLQGPTTHSNGKDAAVVSGSQNASPVHGTNGSGRNTNASGRNTSTTGADRSTIGTQPVRNATGSQ